MCEEKRTTSRRRGASTTELASWIRTHVAQDAQREGAERRRRTSRARDQTARRGRGPPQIDLRETVRPEELRDLAAVEGVVRQHPHEHRLPGVPLRRRPSLAREFLEEHRSGPPLEASLDDPPGRFERADDLRRAARRR